MLKTGKIGPDERTLYSNSKTRDAAIKHKRRPWRHVTGIIIVSDNCHKKVTPNQHILCQTRRLLR